MTNIKLGGLNNITVPVDSEGVDRLLFATASRSASFRRAEVAELADARDSKSRGT